MDGSIAVSAADRKALLALIRAAVGVRSRQAHVVLRRGDGWSHRQIRLATFASFDFIADALRLYRRRGLAAFAEPQARRPLPPWATILRRWVEKLTPEDFGYFRRRWSCETLAHTLAFEHGTRVSAETVRRTLHRLGFAWRRPGLADRDARGQSAGDAAEHGIVPSPLRRVAQPIPLGHVHPCDLRQRRVPESRAVVAYLERWGHRIDLHFLPCNGPETNPIERAWWSLHKTQTRNHKCASLDDLLNDVYLWIETQPCFYGPELHYYATAP